MIFNLFFPSNHFINNNILKKYDSLVYKTFKNTIQLIIQVNKEIIIIKQDLKFAFYHISINSYNYWFLLFKWNGKFYVNIFLLFDLRIASRIFNLFTKVLHWIFNIFHEWNVTHYLDDFLFIFSFDINLSSYFLQFDQVLSLFELSKVIEKNFNDYIIIHLEFEFNFNMMKVIFSFNKKITHDQYH